MKCRNTPVALGTLVAGRCLGSGADAGGLRRRGRVPLRVLRAWGVEGVVVSLEVGNTVFADSWNIVCDRHRRRSPARTTERSAE
jgi:hypothetical protein